MFMQHGMTLTIYKHKASCTEGRHRAFSIMKKCVEVRARLNNVLQPVTLDKRAYYCKQSQR